MHIIVDHVDARRKEIGFDSMHYQLSAWGIKWRWKAIKKRRGSSIETRTPSSKLTLSYIRRPISDNIVWALKKILIFLGSEFQVGVFPLQQGQGTK